MQIVFCGSAGGRYSTTLQKRYTGGILINAEKKMLIDPGPGSLIRCLEFKQQPWKIDVLLISHYHTDHYVDAPVIIEAMTGMTQKKKGILIASRKIIEGDEEDVQAISNYHKSLLEKIYAVGPGEKIKLDGLTVKTTPTRHAEKTGVGFRFDELSLSYTGDTSVFKEMIEAHKGVKTIIVNLIRPDLEKIEGIMTVGSCLEFLEKTRPEQAILTHFGVSVLKQGPEVIAKKIEKESRVRTIPAKDGMKLEFDTEQKKLTD